MISAPRHSLQNQIFFYGVFAVLSILAFWLVSDFIGIIAFSFVMVIILKPVHDWYMQLLGKRKGLSTLFTLLTLLVVLVVPGWLTITVATNQMSGVIEEIAAGGDPLSMDEVQANLNEMIQGLPFPGVKDFEFGAEQLEKIRATMSDAAQWAAGLLVNLGMSLPLLLANTFIFLGIVGSVLPNYHEFANRLRHLSPLDDEVNNLYLRKIKAMVWSMFVGIFVIAIIQGLLMGVFYWIGAIPLLGLWTIISIIAAMMPLGASLVALPVGIVQLVLGNTISGITILAGYLLLVANIDNLIRPRLVSKEAYLGFALILLSALGGYQLFGFFGVIYGPVLMILFQTTIDVYQEYYLDKSSSQIPQEERGLIADGSQDDNQPTEETVA